MRVQLRRDRSIETSSGKKPRRRRKRAARRGRITTAEKIAQAERTERVFPEDVSQRACRSSHTRACWRLEHGRAVLVAYDVRRGPGNRYGVVPGVLGRSPLFEIKKGGIETRVGPRGRGRPRGISTRMSEDAAARAEQIVIAIAYQVDVVGLSFDKGPLTPPQDSGLFQGKHRGDSGNCFGLKVCLLMNFFQNLSLRKSQADALLNQLAQQWAREFDTLCTLLAHSAVVHADETSWSIHSVWIFLSENVRVLLFGVHKDAATLAQILDPATFGGKQVRPPTGQGGGRTDAVGDDHAAVYAHFTRSQKCWSRHGRSVGKGCCVM